MASLCFTVQRVFWGIELAKNSVVKCEFHLQVVDDDAPPSSGADLSLGFLQRWRRTKGARSMSRIGRSTWLQGRCLMRRSRPAAGSAKAKTVGSDRRWDRRPWVCSSTELCRDDPAD
jgi:hypothetical protein